MSFPDETRLRRSASGHATRAKHHPDSYTRAGRAEAARLLRERLLAEVDPDGSLPEAEREARLKAAVSAHFARLAARQAEARRQHRRLADAAREDAALAALAEALR